MDVALVRFEDRLPRDAAAMIPDGQSRGQRDVGAINAAIVVFSPVDDGDEDVLLMAVLHVLREDQVHVVAGDLPPEPAAVQALHVPAMLLVPGPSDGEWFVVDGDGPVDRCLGQRAAPHAQARVSFPAFGLPDEGEVH